MKIRLLIANGYVSGGTARTTVNTANALADRGHDVEIVSVFRRRRKPNYEIDPRVKLRPLVDLVKHPARRKSGALLPHPRDVLRTRPSRMMHPHDVRYHGYSLYTDLRVMRFLRSVDDGVLVSTRPLLNLAVARWANPAVVRVAQEHMNLATHSPDMQAAFRRYFPRLDAVAALTQTDAQSYADLLGDTTKVVAMPNGVPDIKQARAALENKVVIAAGRLTRQKGFDRLVPAFARVVEQRPDWHLRIFGGGVLHDQIRKWIDDCKVQDNVHLMGFTTQLHHEMEEASIFVMSSRREGLPMVLLEAIGCGLPVVSFDCPTGPRDLITDGVDGLLTPEGDEAALAKALLQLIDDVELRKRMGAAALVKAEQYDTATLAARWEELFAEAAAAKATDEARGRRITRRTPRTAGEPRDPFLGWPRAVHARRRRPVRPA